MSAKSEIRNQKSEIRSWFRVSPWNTAAAEPVEILIYDTIGKDYWDNSGFGAQEFANALKDIPKNREILLRIHSPGGSVWDGLAIYNQIRERRDKVTAQIDGVAFSAASFIAMAAGTVRMPKTGRMMIHDASGLAIGNATEMRQLADLLDQESDNIAAIYAEKTKTPAAEIRAMMRETKWMTGEEAHALGFADELTYTAVLNCTFDLSAFRRVPDGILNSGTPENLNTNPHLVMNRAQLIALLNRHGIQFENSATDADLLALVQNIPTAPAAPPAPAAPRSQTPDPIPDPEVAQIRAQLATERRLRVTREVRAEAEAGRIPAGQIESWTNRAVADETVLNDLRALPAHVPGAEPLRASLENNGNSLLENYRKMKVGKDRETFRVENFDQLVRVTRQLDPRNANTLAAGLIPDFLADAMITIANNRLAPLRAFSRDFGVDPMRPKASVEVAKATVGSTTQTNATNFESGDSTLAAIAVTVNQVTQSFHLANQALNQGFRIAQLAQINADTFVNALSDIYTALMIVGNYGATTVIGAAASFDRDDLPAIWSLAKKYRSRNLLLDGSHLAFLIPKNGEDFTLGQSGAFGFDFLGMQNRWTNATANTAGFVCSPDAIAVASGLPVEGSTPQGEFLSRSMIPLPDIGLTVLALTWFSRSSRTLWASYDIMFGAAAGDTTQAEVLVTA